MSDTLNQADALERNNNLGRAFHLMKMLALQVKCFELKPNNRTNKYNFSNTPKKELRIKLNLNCNNK